VQVDDKIQRRLPFLAILEFSSFSICFYSLLCAQSIMSLTTFPVHIFVSNQSLENPNSVINIELDGKHIFQKQMSTGTQHTWEKVSDAISLSEGTHTLSVSEVNTNTSKSQGFIVRAELWIAVTFHGQESGFKLDLFDHPIAFM
jgi:hypothetical protein